MMIVTTIAEQTRFNRRNHGFSLNAANAPVSLLPAAPCSTNRRRRIPEAPFPTCSARGTAWKRIRRFRSLLCYVALRRGREYDASVSDYSGLAHAEASEPRA